MKKRVKRRTQYIVHTIPNNSVIYSNVIALTYGARFSFMYKSDYIVNCRVLKHFYTLVYINYLFSN